MQADRQGVTTRKGCSVMLQEARRKERCPSQGQEDAQSKGWWTRVVCGSADLVRVIPALPLTTG